MCYFLVNGAIGVLLPLLLIHRHVDGIVLLRYHISPSTSSTPGVGVMFEIHTPNALTFAVLASGLHDICTPRNEHVQLCPVSGSFC